MIVAVSSVNSVKSIYNENFSKINNDSHQQTNYISFKAGLNRIESIIMEYGEKTCNNLPFSLTRFKLRWLLKKPKLTEDGTKLTRKYKQKLIKIVNKGDALLKKADPVFDAYEDERPEFEITLAEDIAGAICRIPGKVKKLLDDFFYYD